MFPIPAFSGDRVWRVVRLRNKIKVGVSRKADFLLEGLRDKKIIKVNYSKNKWKESRVNLLLAIWRELPIDCKL